MSTSAPSPERTVRWGLVGCGDIAERRVAAALGQSRGSELVAVARARAELAADFAARHGARRGHADWRDLLRDDEVDAVYLATPVRWHAEQAVAAAEAGKHVLCEKPMALDVAECERMISAARSHGVRLGVAYYRHHYPVVARLRELLASGEIGDPVLAQALAFEPFDLPHDHPRAWLLRRSQAGGGPMADFGCHRIEVLLDLLGPCEEARGSSANVRFREREVEDTCVAQLRFRRGPLATVAVTHAAQVPRDTLEIFGTRGSAQVPVLNQGVLRVTTGAGEREERHPPHANLHQPLVEDFVAAVREGREPAVNGEVGLEVTRVLASLYRERPEPAGGEEGTAPVRQILNGLLDLGRRLARWRLPRAYRRPVAGALIVLAAAAAGGFAYIELVEKGFLRYSKWDRRVRGTLRVGDPAPDLELARYDGSRIRLSSVWETKPAVLVFGSCT